MAEAAPASPAAPIVPPPVAETSPSAPAPAAAPSEAKPAEVAPVAKPRADEFAKFARRESEFQKKSQAETARLAEERKAFDAERAAFAARAEAVRDLEEAKASKDPRAAMKALGYTYEEITRAELEAGTADDPGAKALREVEALKAAQIERESAAKRAEEARAKEAEDAKKAQSVEAYSKWQGEISDFVKADPEAYELTLLQGRVDLVTQSIEQHYRKTCEVDHTGKVLRPGKILSPKEAADLVEAYLVEEGQKLLKTKKFAPNVASPPPPADVKAPAPAEPKTLSNGLATSTPAVNSGPRTDKERRAAAIAAMERAEAARK